MSQSNSNIYSPKVNLAPIFSGNVAIVTLCNGLADQISQYIFGEIFEDMTGRKVYYDDFPLFVYAPHGYYLRDIMRRKDRIFTDFLSYKLLYRLKCNLTRVDGEIKAILAMKEFFALRKYCDFHESILTVCWEIHSILNEKQGKLARSVFDGLVNVISQNQMERFINCSKFVPENLIPYFAWNVSARLRFDYKRYFENNIIFPPHTDPRNVELEKDMLSCDAIVIHIRRGDFADAGRLVKSENYKFEILKVVECMEYLNKKWYVFSDDMDYCREHENEYGLNLIEKVYVDWNGRDVAPAYVDMALMSNAKVMISLGGTGYSATAFMIGRRGEAILPPVWSFKNKYDFEKGEVG